MHFLLLYLRGQLSAAWHRRRRQNRGVTLNSGTEETKRRKCGVHAFGTAAENRNLASGKPFLKPAWLATPGWEVKKVAAKSYESK